MDDFREAKLKLNDDKKIRINLNKLTKPGRTIILTVRTHDLRRNPPKENEFDKAWYRLINEDTN